MAYQLKDGQGSLFRNDKAGNDRRPDYAGKLMVDGKLLRLVAWVREPQSGGEKYLSIAAEPWKDRQARAEDENQDHEAARDPDTGTELPF